MECQSAKIEAMRLLILTLVALIFIQSCKKDATDKIKDGVYTGTFSRSGPLSNHVVSNVVITFNGNMFSGTSDVDKYPAICKGTFNAGASKMKVVNECVFTADFDGTFIFNGEYEYEVDGAEIEIVKRYPNSTYVDRYLLKRGN